jgi:probable rRNA maturation factor
MPEKKNLYTIRVHDQQKWIKIDSEKAQELARSVLMHEKVSSRVPVELSVAFVDDKKIRVLNREYHSQDCATDVLAFPMDEKPPKLGPWFLGEVIVSTERAADVCGEYQNTLEREAALYMVHGILHLLGYRDHRAADYKKMFKTQNIILENSFKGLSRK